MLLKRELGPKSWAIKPLFTVAVGSRSIGKSSPAVHLDKNQMMIVANDLERLSRDAFSVV